MTETGRFCRISDRTRRLREQSCRAHLDAGEEPSKAYFNGKVSAARLAAEVVCCRGVGAGAGAKCGSRSLRGAHGGRGDDARRRRANRARGPHRVAQGQVPPLRPVRIGRVAHAASLAKEAALTFPPDHVSIFAATLTDGRRRRTRRLATKERSTPSSSAAFRSLIAFAVINSWSVITANCFT